MALAMSKLGGLGGGGGSSGGGGGSHASQDPQDKIVCILLLTFIPLLIRVLQIALAMSQAGKLFDKKNAGTGGGAGSANNQAAKVQGPLPHSFFNDPSIGFFIHYSDALCCDYSNASMWSIQDNWKSKPGTRGCAELDGRCDVVLKVMQRGTEKLLMKC
jgi:hypothetical protein